MRKHAFYDSAFGIIKIGYCGGKIFSIKRVESIDEINAPSKLTDEAFKQLSEYFDGNRKTFDLPIALQGTHFQLSVWNELIKIPYGKVASYKDVAEAIGNHKACRAVGLANKRNPLWIVVPCHRVIGSNNDLTGYAGGLEMKAKLLELEKNNAF